jgi:peptidoglycan/xylan/chitin deacetylase (PgdA/CDA1 family)
MSIRRAARATPPGLLAVVAVAALATFSAADALTQNGPPLVRDPPDAHGPLDVSAVGLAQDGGVLALTVRLRGGAPLSALGVAGRSLCLRLAAASGAATGEVCLRARPARLGLEFRRLAAREAPQPVVPISGRVLRPSLDTVVVRFHAADVGLVAGPFGWSVRTTWRGAGPCAARPGSASSCADRAPNTGSLPGNLAPVPAATTCAPAGADLRANGSRLTPDIALTFDDGPGPSTPAVLSALERERAPATFFVVGEHVAGQDSVLQRMLRDGDAIGDHSFTHADLAGGGAAAQVEIDETKRAIERATGYVPCLFRAPFGDVSPALLSDARVQGLITVQWDVDPRDWSLPGPNRIAATVLTQARDGSIVLMHDGGGPREQTVEALPGIVDSLRGRGFRLVTVPQLLGLAPGPA